MPVCRTILDRTSCSGEPGARGRGGPSCADADPCTIDAAPATSLGGASIRAAGGAANAPARLPARRTLVTVRLNAAAELDRGARSGGGRGMM